MTTMTNQAGQEIRWTPERVAIMQNLRRVGIKDQTLGKLLGVSQQRITKVCGPRPNIGEV